MAHPPLSRILRAIWLAGLFWALLTRADAQTVVINEVLINGPGTCDNACMPNTEEWIELYNTSCQPVNIGCYRLTDGDFNINIPANTVIPAQGYFLIGSNNSPVGNATLNLNVATCGCATGFSSNQVMRLENASEQLVLFTNAGVIEDAIRWGAGQGVPITRNAPANSSCGTLSMSLPAAASADYEIIGTGGGNGCTKARQSDGASQWTDKCGGEATPGAANALLPGFVTVTNSSTVCPGQGVNLTATGGVTYSWWPAVGLSATTGAVVTANPPQTTLYTVTGTNAQGCKATDTTLITVFPLVTVSPGQAQLCSGQSISLTASGASNYSWSNGQTGSIISVSPTDTTTYTAFGFSAAGCTSSASATVNVIPGPAQPIVVSAGASPSTFCQGSGTALTATGAATYSWSPGTGLLFSQGSTVFANPNNSITYTVTGTTGGCSASATVQVNVLPTPAMSLLTSATSICLGNTANITASGAASYTWSPAAGLNVTAGPIVMATPSVNTTYVVTGTGANGCTSTANVALAVKPLPVVSATTTDTLICQGSVASLSATGATSYSWGPGLSGATVNVTPNVTANYVVYGTQSSTGCRNTATLLVEVLPAPPVTASAAVSAFCSGGSTALSAAGALSYSWSPAAGLSGTATNVVTATPTVSTNYTVTGTGPNGCTKAVPVPVTIFALPNLSVFTISDSVCLGAGTTLTASGADAYSWSTGAVTPQLTVSPTATTTYSVTGTSAQGCQGNSASQTVTVSAVPNVAVAGPQNICPGAPGTLLASGADSYSWWPSIGLSVQTGASVQALPGATTTYTVEGKNFSGCADTATFLATVMPAVNMSAVANPATICQGQSSTLSAGGATAYSWYSGQTTAAITVSPAATSVYTVIGTEGICTDTALVLLSVNPTPDLQISPVAPVICEGASVSLSASGAANYSWFTGQTSASISANPTTATSYTVTGANGSCSDTASVLVTVSPVPVVTLTANQAICQGHATVLTASGATSYSWFPFNGLSAITGSSVMANPAATTHYTVIGTNAGNCTDTAYVTVMVMPAPAVAVSATAAVLCEGQSSTLSATGAASYSWFTGQTTAAILVSPSAASAYTVVGTLGTCTDTATIQLQVNPVPVVSATVSAAAVCQGQPVTLGAAGAASYSWSTGNITPGFTATPAASTTYTVVGSSLGCADTAIVAVTVNPLPNLVSTPGTNICQGLSAVLTASGADSYTWTPATGLTTTTGPTVTAQPTVSTIYTVIGTTNLGCSISDTVSLAVSSTITVSGSAAMPAVCAGSPTTLSAWGADVFSWNTGQTSATISVSPTATTTYTVTGSLTTGACTDTALLTVQVNPLPVISVLSDAPAVCAGGSTTLTATGANTYSWSHGSLSNPTTVTPGATTTYTVTGTTLGCEGTDTFEVTVNPYPMVSIVPDSLVICAGNQVNLTALGADAYSWHIGAAVPVISVQPLATTTYSVTGISAGCETTTSTTVTVQAVPQIVLSPSVSVCEGEATTLSASGASTFTWSTTETGPAISVSPGTTTTYTVLGTLQNCSATATSTVSVNPIPDVLITPAAAVICAGNTVSLQAFGAGSYSWSTLETSAAISPSPAANQTYTVIGTLNGCSDTATVAVTVKPVPAVLVQANLPTVCVGGEAILSASGADSYAWSTGAAGQQISVFPAATTTFWVQGTTDGCTSAQTSVTINTVAQAPAPAVASNSPVCAGTALNLTASGTSGATYSWMGPNGFTSVAQYPVLPNISAINSGAYSVVTSIGNCQSLPAVTVVNTAEMPQLLVQAFPAAICEGTTATLNAGGALTYTWFTPAGILLADSATVAVSPGSSSTYTLLGSNGVCIDTALVPLTVNPSPTAMAGPDVTIESGTTTLLQASGGLNYAWSPGLGLSDLFVPDPIASPFQTTTYTVTVTDENGCSDTASVKVTVNLKLQVPNGFTPNNDGINDTWEMPLLTESYPNCHVEIFNRWGGIVYTSIGYSIPWDGKVNGNLLPNSTFYYVIHLAPGEAPISGSVTILK